MLDGKTSIGDQNSGLLSFWTIDDGLLLLRKDGVPAARSNSVSRDPTTGKRKLTGTYLLAQGPFDNAGETFELQEL
jgi:hypothetical protein